MNDIYSKDLSGEIVSPEPARFIKKIVNNGK